MFLKLKPSIYHNYTIPWYDIFSQNTNWIKKQPYNFQTIKTPYKKALKNNLTPLRDPTSVILQGHL